MIVACTRADDPRWLALRRQLFPHHADDVLLAEMARFCADPRRHGQFLRLAADGTPLGFIELALRTDYVNGTRSTPVAFLEAILVAPDARRQGIARALVAHAQAWARERGCREFASDAHADNTASHAMHRALGFEETQRVVFFRKDIAAD